MPTDDMQDIPIVDKELPRRDVPARSAQQELHAAGYNIAKKAACMQCGKVVTYMESPAGASLIPCNFDGSLHVNCRESRDPVPEPLPPPLTFEQQQEKLDELMRERGMK
jgi:hypothetical protein